MKIVERGKQWIFKYWLLCIFRVIIVKLSNLLKAIYRKIFFYQSSVTYFSARYKTISYKFYRNIKRRAVFGKIKNRNIPLHDIDTLQTYYKIYQYMIHKHTTPEIKARWYLYWKQIITYYKIWRLEINLHTYVWQTNLMFPVNDVEDFDNHIKKWEIRLSSIPS